MPDIASLPVAQSCRLIDFDSVEVRPGFVTDTFFLIVRGSAACLNMEVSLRPLIYVTCPEYWGIEVVGCLPQGICLDAILKYEKVLDLSGIRGSKGIEVVGASKRKKQDVSGGCQAAQKLA